MDTGTLVGNRYRIVREVGRGGMGIVYEAIQEDLRRPVALKVMRGLQCSGEDYDRFLREARIAASVSSPHLVQVLDFSPSPLPFIVMELLVGDTLADRLRAGPLPESEVVRFAQQLLSVLVLVHRQGVVHRDLKPANIFFTHAEGLGKICKLLDFGIAKLAQSTRGLTQDGAMLGTVPYMAPEQLLHQAEVTPGSDLYALGVCMFEALTGRRPTTRVDFAGIVAELESTPSPTVRSIRPDLSAELAAFVDCAIARHPAQRFPNASAMAAALEALAHRVPGYGQTPGSVPAQAPSFAVGAQAFSASASVPPQAPLLAPMPGSGAFAPSATLGTGAVAVAAPRRSLVGFVVFGLALTVAAGVGVGVYFGRDESSDNPVAKARDAAVATLAATVTPSSPSSATLVPTGGTPTGAGGKSKTPRSDAGPSPSTSPSIAPSGSALPSSGEGTLNSPCPKERERETFNLKGTRCLSGTWKCRDFNYRACGDHCEEINDFACTACGTRCALGSICKLDGTGKVGTCQACGSSETFCKRLSGLGECVDLNFSQTNCGRCGNFCRGRCTRGECQ